MLHVALIAENPPYPEATRRDGLRRVHDALHLELAARLEFARAMGRRAVLEDDVRQSRGDDNVPVQDEAAAREFAKQLIAMP